MGFTIMDDVLKKLIGNALSLQAAVLHAEMFPDYAYNDAQIDLHTEMLNEAVDEYVRWRRDRNDQD